MRLVAAARGVGPRGLVRLARRRLWSSHRSLGLRARLDAIVEPRPARIPVRMVVTDPGSFHGFDEELAQVSAGDSVEVLGRTRFCRGGVERLYVAGDERGRPIYAQWLVPSGEQAKLEAVTRGLFPALGADEVLIEGAYTFSDFRKLGAMADGMAQLLRFARDDDAAGSALTYVTEDNVPSLRGCARAGFDLDHVRLTTRRLGVRRSARRPLDDEARAAWTRALA